MTLRVLAVGRQSVMHRGQHAALLAARGGNAGVVGALRGICPSWLARVTSLGLGVSLVLCPRTGVSHASKRRSCLCLCAG